eukprot:TRINITY_DN1167_c0_g1_i1.p1 TRINITY_DN1167_c0_g1~~TRINITY_DN1167_c0_g1_i1.p1  ORF type:complete len:410 (+),score=148.98 TRINITY_DN1167_c0_g1_i1:92-1321(+)
MTAAAMDEAAAAPAGAAAPAADAAPAATGAQSTLAGVLERADALTVASPADAEPLYRRIIDGGSDLAVTPEDDVNAIKQAAIIGLADVLIKCKRAAEVATLTKTLHGYFATIPKAKTAKLVRTLIDHVSASEVAVAPGQSPEEAKTAHVKMQADLCEQTIAWCRTEKRTFLRQRIQGRLASLQLEAEQYTAALSGITELLREVKRLDDKAHLLEVQLLECRAQHALRNGPKARAALTAARTTANAIYVPLTLQAAIDMQAGVVSAEEKDYKTAYSYFYEAFEGFSSLGDSRAVSNLKYMLLCKIMVDLPGDVVSLSSTSTALKHSGREVDAMKAVAAAHSKRSLEGFESALNEYEVELKQDATVRTHLTVLYDTLLTGNLLRIIEPYSRVEISHVAELIQLPARRLSPS